MVAEERANGCMAQSKQNPAKPKLLPAVVVPPSVAAVPSSSIWRSSRRRTEGSTRLALKRITENVILILPRRFYMKENRVDIECTATSEHLPKDHFASVNRPYQSVTRKLAFGGYDDERRGSTNPYSLEHFYNNTTLSAVTKLFSAIVIAVVFFMLIRRLVIVYQIIE
uniref:Neur_chan_memb domain-containing protein n=1 Tax=Steinernema glaseri TaxID=37863 RepID=A0A1I7YJP5_9BILA